MMAGSTPATHNKKGKHMKLFKMVLFTLAFVLGTASFAHADGFRSYRVCGGDQFTTCAAVTINVVGSDVTVNLWNLSGNGFATYGVGDSTHAGTVFNGIGFYNTSGVSAVLGSLAMSGPARAGDTPTNWKLMNSGRVNFMVDFGAGAQKNMDNGIASGCATSGQLPSGVDLYQNPCTGLAPGGWTTFTFKVTGDWNPNDSDLVIRGLNGPTGTATECWTGETPTGTVANCATVTPEPISMTLMATGLAGMGGMGFFKRRKQNVE